MVRATWVTISGDELPSFRLLAALIFLPRGVLGPVALLVGTLSVEAMLVPSLGLANRCSQLRFRLTLATDVNAVVNARPKFVMMGW